MIQYWGNDRVEPRPSATYSSTSTKSPHLSSVAAFRASAAASQKQSSTASSSSHADPNNQGTAAARGALGNLSLVTGSGSTPNLRSLSPSKRQAAENVVAGSHAAPRVNKFGNRLRSPVMDSALSGNGNGGATFSSAPSSAHGHHESSSGSGSGSGGGAPMPTNTGRISGTHHAQFAQSGRLGPASIKSPRVSNGSR
ncbi:hypothetical protein OC861_004540 [Tilletia horrida]|nr:hypothetical protein OC861_004540 [Tilletia horrida]